jgi:hypothetical protein
MACDSPVYVRWKNPRGHLEWLPLPCGSCPPCIKRRIDGWVFRMLEEDRVSRSSHFLTLTYNPDHVPKQTIVHNGVKKRFVTLRKKHGQNFIKLLRKKVYEDFPNNGPIKYYMVGEYGSSTRRPHLHCIVFNVPSEAYFGDAWSRETKTGSRRAFGKIDVGQVTNNSIAYCVAYMNKVKSHGSNAWPGSEKEFWLSSARIGASYLIKSWNVKEKKVKVTRKKTKKSYVQTRKIYSPKEYTSAYYWHRETGITYLTRPGGYRIAMPRYYRNIIWSDAERSEQIPVIRDALAHEEQKIRRQCREAGITYEELIHNQKDARIRIFHQKSLKYRDYD